MKNILNILVVLATLLMVTSCSSTKNGGLSSNAASSMASEFERNVGDRVFFALDSSSLKDESKAQLTKQAEWLSKYPNVKVTVEGHCDERGTREYNMALGEKRAEVVKRYLLSHGVSEDRVETVSYGKERPAVIGNDENAWSQNRRGVTVIK